MRWCSLLVIASLAAACADEPPPATDGDAIPERLLSRDDIHASYARAGDWYVSPVLEAETGATRAGFLLTVTSEDAPTPIVEARAEDGAWVRAEETFADGTQRVLRADLGLVTRSVEMRIHAADLERVEGVLWSAVVPLDVSTLPAVAELPEVAARAEPLRGDLSDIVQSRVAWGARGPRCSSNDPSKYRMAIHHTVTPASGDPASRLRGIQAYHMDSNGWCDIGYHFLVSLDGRLWEGRELSDLGTHVASNNSGNIGISFIGCFQTSGCSDWTPHTPPSAMLSSAATLVGRLAGIYGITVNSSTVKGHRDHSGASTSCPGDNLHAQLDAIRSGSVAPPDFAAEYVNQSFPLARDPYPLNAGTEDEGYLEMRNVGAATWRPGETFLGATEPRDGASAIAASDWVSPSRAATVDRDVPPGETGRFVFRVRAPDAPGDYPQYFNLVQEGVAWFGDPGQGGPPDNQLQIRVTSMAWDAGPMPPDAGVMGGRDAGPEIPMGDASMTVVDAGGLDRGMTPVDDGCGCSVPGRGEAPSWPGLAALGLFACVLARRRGMIRRWRR